MKTGQCKYILKLIDHMYNSWSYCYNGLLHPMGKQGFFLEESLFNTPEEAKQHIQWMLNSGWYRHDVTESSFEIVEVWKHDDHPLSAFWYTDHGYQQIYGDKEVK